MDTRKLSIVPTNDFTPGMEGSVHIALDGESVVPYVEEELAAELVRRWNAHNALVEALEALMGYTDDDVPARFAKGRAALESLKP